MSAHSSQESAASTSASSEQGWRAEKARPVRLWLPFERWQLARPLSETYRVPVGLSNILRS